MAGYLYFLPGNRGSGVRTEDLPDPLRPVLSGSSLESGSPVVGPDGDAGMVLARAGRRQLAVYRDQPDKQRWAPVYDPSGDGRSTLSSDGQKPLYWIGYDVQDPPTPADLTRAKSLGGRAVELADGQRWLIPSIHVQSHIPRQMHYAEGRYELRYDPRYEEIVEEGRRWFEWTVNLAAVEAREGKGRTYLEAVEFLARILSINYHVGLVEICFARPLIGDGQVYGPDLWGAIFGLTDVLEDTEQKKGVAAT